MREFCSEVLAETMSNCVLLHVRVHLFSKALPHSLVKLLGLRSLGWVVGSRFSVLTRVVYLVHQSESQKKRGAPGKIWWGFSRPCIFVFCCKVFRGTFHEPCHVKGRFSLF
jgi:hypothetical protein